MHCQQATPVAGNTFYGLKVFMDAYGTVTAEERDRYPLGPHPQCLVSSMVERRVDIATTVVRSRYEVPQNNLGRWQSG